MNLKGIHHVSAITANAQKNHDFYTSVMGMRLVKKTVNQDSPSMYHLFYADAQGSPGTDFTFFEIPGAGHTYPGNQSISTTSLRVKDDAALQFWKDRFTEHDVDHDSIKELMGKATLSFRDPEGQRLMLISDEYNQGVEPGIPWSQRMIPEEFSIIGLGPVFLTVADIASTRKVLTEILSFKEISEEDNFKLFETGKGGSGAQVALIEDSVAKRERPGRGSVHHVAFRVADETELEFWKTRIEDSGMQNSGIVDRYYFKSLYFREPNHILFELATDGPGFTADEEFDELGKNLALPPFLEKDRTQIEAQLKPLQSPKE